MKTNFRLLFAAFFFSSSIYSQTRETILKAVHLVPERKIELNGGARAQVGGKSRTFIPVDLPVNTKEWYYSFTTSEGVSGTSNLNLALQVSSLLIDPTGFSAKVMSSVKVPGGVSSADVFLLDRRNLDLFLAKEDEKCRIILDASVTNTMQGLVKVDQVKAGTWYLGLKNPATWDGIQVNIEVVAIVEETKVIAQTAEQKKAEMYGTLGWKAYERGEYDKCLELSNEAIKYDSALGWVHSNIGLVKLIKGDLISAIDSYSKAISIFKKQEQPKLWFDAAIADLKDLAAKKGKVEGAEDIMEMLKGEN